MKRKEPVRRDDNESRVRPMKAADELTKPELDTGFELKMPHVDVTKKVPDRVSAFFVDQLKKFYCSRLSCRKWTLSTSDQCKRRASVVR